MQVAVRRGSLCSAEHAQVRRPANHLPLGLLPERYRESVKDAHSLIQTTYRRQELPHRGRQQAGWPGEGIGRDGSVGQVSERDGGWAALTPAIA